MAIRTSYSARGATRMTSSATVDGATSTSTNSTAYSTQTGSGEGGNAGMGVQVAGTATGVGNDTLAAASVSVEGTSGGSARSISASATFNAASETQPGGSGVAYTGSAIAFSGSADRLMRTDFASEHSFSDSSGSRYEANSRSSLYAFDRGGRREAERDQDRAQRDADREAGRDDGPEVNGHADLDGNVVIFDVKAVAYGDDNFVGVDLMALTVDDHLSTVDTIVTVNLG
ncbi:hypothetical protein ACFOD4_16635 [Pseudoroseomonas globiformis]|uniref:Uncharacterized protein n=2 Tax=Teichococcus globiformis TaxID=2307229 RepID=A0ABV7G1U4_9PROT